MDELPRVLEAMGSDQTTEAGRSSSSLIIRSLNSKLRPEINPPRQTIQAICSVSNSRRTTSSRPRMISPLLVWGRSLQSITSPVVIGHHRDSLPHIFNLPSHLRAAFATKTIHDGSGQACGLELWRWCV